ncbi:hypothetical protein QO009_003838 [Brevibacillus aydinogluensis]|jgi:hypothetical protein|uniref:hypothetical protein n=1 Tax=Brevibacillus aydinogluensis TaxID=927786 RepID=UPI000E37957A|nr:hypothetical protein [Brevibacillus aydinogluensis]MDT3417924.1 hypothetical protein [Brevibacillus aydinogluensis]REK62008.1 MAG: hypothetical protein DF221_14400 [Brevibacillus sp.]
MRAIIKLIKHNKKYWVFGIPFAFCVGKLFELTVESIYFGVMSAAFPVWIELTALLAVILLCLLFQDKYNEASKNNDHSING